MQIVRNRTRVRRVHRRIGAGGGMAAMVLTQAGANVVMLEAGPMWDGHVTPRWLSGRCQTPTSRRLPRSERHFGEFDGRSAAGRSDGGASTRPQPAAVRLVSLADARRTHKPLVAYLSAVRAARLHAQELDGLGDDWPITYDDIKPYYDKIDRFIGIFGANLTAACRNEPDGIFHAAAGAALLRAADQAGVRQAERPSRAVAPVDPDASR